MPRDTIERLNPRSVRETDADKLLVPFSESHGHQGRVINVKMTWPRFCDRVGSPRIDNLTFKEYKALPIAEQHRRKNQGYFVGGQFDKGVRKIGNIKERSLLAFDIDRCSPEILAELRKPFDLILAEYDYLIHSTRNHTDAEPRIRLIVPLAKSISVEKFAPLQRILAWHIDKAMETVDPISFRPAQIMYWPSVCKGAPYVYQRHRGKLLDGDAVLNEWGDWKDYHKLPVSPRDDKARKAAEKATDPRTKKGVIGAFCRVYSVYDVIDKFLSHIYVPGDQDDRYTFVDGSTANGAVIYDEGLFLYSHHGTDPCSGRLVHGFDLRRIQEFGHLDKPEDIEKDDVTSLPSYKAMIKAAQEDPLVIEELAKDHLPDEEYIADFDADEPADDNLIAPARERTPASAPAREATSQTEPSTDWMKKLEKDGNGKIKSTLPNIRIILDHDDRLKGSLAYNDLLERPVLLRRILSKHFSDTTVTDKINGDELTDEVYVTIRMILETPPTRGGFGLTVSERDLRDAILGAAHAARVNPITKYLRSLVWDKKPRIRKIFTRYFHAEPNPIYETFGYNFMVAAAMRVFEPGSKFDFVPVLQGPQGCGKSTGCAVLSGSHFFGELNADFDERARVVEQLLGRWIVELPELSQFHQKADIERIKAVISAQEDRVRLAWSRAAKNYKRRSVFIGTTNKDVFLKDPTGNRRFWPVVLTGKMVDLAALRRDRDQLWAEAVHEYLYMRFDCDEPNLPLHIGEDQIAAVEAAQEQHTEIDDHQLIANRIEEWLETPVSEAASGYYFRPKDENDDPDSGSENAKMVKRDSVILDDIAYYALERPNFDPRKDTRLIAKAMELIPGWKKRVASRRPNIKVGDLILKRTVYDRVPERPR